MPDHDQSASAPGPLARLAQIALLVAAIALVGLVLVQGWQVFARYVLNDSPSWTEPVTVLLLSTAMSLAAAAGVHGQRHFSFNLLAESAGPARRRLMGVTSHVVVGLVGGVLAVGASRLWLDGLGVSMAGAPLPQGSGYFPLALGGLLMLVFAIGHLRLVPRRDAGGEG